MKANDCLFYAAPAIALTKKRQAIGFFFPLFFAQLLKHYMSILVNKSSKIIVSGIHKARKGHLSHATQMIDYGTQVVGGVTPRQGRQHAHRPPRIQHRGRCG